MVKKRKNLNKIHSDNLSKSNLVGLKKIKHFYNKYKDLINASENFPLFISREVLAGYLARYELYKETKKIKGSIIECGSYKGSSLLLYAKLTSIFEPYQIHKKVISFDTFSGFPSIHKKDNKKYKHAKKNYLDDTSLNLIKDSIKVLDANRFNSHINKVEIVQGDATKTIPKYIKKNQHCLISLLILDFDLYEPTKIALDYFLPRMSKSSLIVFDQLNQKRWSGETVAYLEKFCKKKVELKQFDYEPNLSYFKI